MKNAIKLLSKVDETNFIRLYYVSRRFSANVYSIESIMFFDRDDAVLHCDYLNKKDNTDVYIVCRTFVHVH